MARVYTYSQLEALWQQAGGGSHVAPVMAAIALAESGGRVNAKHHDSNGSTDYGLWQINSSHGYNAHDLVTNPLYNAKAAVSVYHSQGLSAWSTYSSGAYKTYLQSGSSGVSTSSGLALPFNPNTTQGPTQIDEGLDFVSKSNYTAVAPGKIVYIDPAFYHGTPAVYEHLDTPVKVNGRTYHGVYYAETNALVKVGQHVEAGQPVIGPGDAEIGFAKRFGSSLSSWLPAAHNQYHEGQPTQAGNDFGQALQNSFQAGFKNAVVQSDPFQKAKTEAGAVAGFLGELTSAALWLRIGEVVGGGLLILMGLYLLAKQVGLAPSVPVLPSGLKDTADDAAGTVDTSQRQPRQPRVVNQYYLDTPSGQTRRTRELARRGADRPSDDIPF